jgi:phosphoglycerol transferase
MIDNGSYLHNHFLGMPWGQELYDYPIADQLHLLLLKVISVFLGDAGATINVYFLATFPLVAVCALVALREFAVSDGPAIVASVLFSLLPFHFLRGETHLFLAVYYLVPLVLMVALWLSLGHPLVGENGERRALSWLLPRGYVALLVVVLSGVAGVYHAFFSGFFLAVGGIVGAVSRRSGRPLVSAVVLVAVLLITIVTALSPSLLYVAREGQNPVAAKRLQFEAELYSLKLVHLVLPIPEHRFPPLAKLRRHYDRAHSWALENENTTAALGLVGSFGFLCLVAHIVFGSPRFRDDEMLSHLARLALAAVLLATAGGFSSLVALLVSAEIRGYNRVSVFLAFLSLFGVAVALDRLSKRWKGRPLLFRCLLGVILALGVLDQTSPTFVPPYGALADTFHSDREFVQRVEASLPPGAMVFELPRVAFFEGPPVNRTRDYEPVSLYLQSRRLRWSYGAMKGRDADDWQMDLLDRPLEEVVERLALVGFAGITVDRQGYPDGGSDIEGRLAGLLQTSVLQSANGRYVFFDLVKFADALRASIDGESWALRREAALFPTLVSWRGCSSEAAPDSGVRLCAPGAEVTFRNTASMPRRVVVEAELAAAEGRAAGAVTDQPAAVRGAPARLGAAKLLSHDSFAAGQARAALRGRGSAYSSFRSRSAPCGPRPRVPCTESAVRGGIRGDREFDTKRASHRSVVGNTASQERRTSTFRFLPPGRRSRVSRLRVLAGARLTGHGENGGAKRKRAAAKPRGFDAEQSVEYPIEAVRQWAQIGFAGLGARPAQPAHQRHRGEEGGVPVARKEKAKTGAA